MDSIAYGLRAACAGSVVRAEELQDLTGGIRVECAPEIAVGEIHARARLGDAGRRRRSASRMEHNCSLAQMTSQTGTHGHGPLGASLSRSPSQRRSSAAVTSPKSSLTSASFDRTPAQNVAMRT